MKIILSILLSLFCFSTIGWIATDIYFSIFPLNESIVDNVGNVPANNSATTYFNVLIVASNIVAIIYNAIFLSLCSKSKLTVGKTAELIASLPWLALFFLILPFSVGKALLFVLIGVTSMVTISSLYFIKSKAPQNNG